MQERTRDIVLLSAYFSEHLLSADAVHTLRELLECEYCSARDKEYESDIETEEGHYGTESDCGFFYSEFCSPYIAEDISAAETAIIFKYR